MKNFTIDPQLKSKWENFSFSALEFEIKINSEYKELIEHLNMEVAKIDSNYDISEVISIPRIKDARDAYKAFGKDPSKYRLAVESLFRRIVKGKGLYHINNVVDTGNLLSLLTRKSTAVLDLDKIKGDIKVRLGKDDDHYEGIGRGKINILNIPLYEDSISPFGSTTSDTTRTMITNETKNILVLLINFSDESKNEEETDLTIELFKKYCSGKLVGQTFIE